MLSRCFGPNDPFVFISNYKIGEVIQFRQLMLQTENEFNSILLKYFYIAVLSYLNAEIVFMFSVGLQLGSDAQYQQEIYFLSHLQNLHPLEQASMSQSKNKPSRKCQKSIFYISFAILLFQAISNSLLAIIGQFTNQNGQGWVGPLSTSLLFCGSGLGSLYNKYIGRMHYRYTFFFGSLGYTLYISLSVVFLKIGFTTFVEVLILVGSFISGLVVSMFYNAQFNYVNTCSQIDQQKTKYFGINMGIVQSCNILGNLASALLVQSVGQLNYAVIMSVSCFIISLLFLGVRDYKYAHADSREIQQRLQSEKNDERGEISVFSDLSPTIQSENVSKNEEVPTRIIFAFCFTGIIISFIYGQLSIVFFDTFQDFYEKEELNRITFVAFIIEGVGEFLGGISVVFGQQFITRKFKLPITYVAATLLFLVAVLSVYVAAYFENLALMNVFSFVVGYCNCMSFTLALTIAGRWRQKGITLFNIGQSGTVAITLAMVAFIPFKYIIVYFLLMYVLASYAVLTYEKRIQFVKLNKILLSSTDQ